MHLSTVGQLAYPAEDGGRRAGRHRDKIMTNGHDLPGREQSDNGGVRPCDDRRTDRDRWTEIWTNRLQQRQTEITGMVAPKHSIQLKLQADGRGGGG